MHFSNPNVRSRNSTASSDKIGTDYVWFGWLSSVWYGLVWFGVVEFDFGLVDDLNENSFVDTCVEDNPKIF